MRPAVDALYALDPGVPREQWLRITFAFKCAGGTEDEFLTWCEGAHNFNLADARTTWRNAKEGGGITEATLFMEARKAGWKPEAAGNGADPVPAPAPRPVRPAQPPPPRVDPTPTWERCVPAARHPYLTRKGIEAHGCRVNSVGLLVVPYYNVAGQLQTVQTITAEGEKRFLRGAKAKGAVAIVGEPHKAGVVVIAEGFATACAIAECTGYACIASGSRVTMPTAAQIARQWAPDARVVLAADRGDLTTPIAAARAVAGFLAVPGGDDEAEGFDFCDWRQQGATPEQIKAAIDHATPPAPGPDELTVAHVGDSGTPDNIAQAIASAEEAGGAVTSGPAFIIAPPRSKGVALNVTNVTRFLTAQTVGTFSFDTFTGLALWNGRPVYDPEMLAIACAVQSAYIGGKWIFANVGVETVRDAITQAARAESFNSCERWLDTLPAWDGIERIPRFFCDVCGVPESDYIHATGKYFWLSLTSRMVRPGCKADSAVVLIGPQGVGKSSLGQVIAGERYGEASLARIDKVDFFAELRGKILVELSELSGHSRAELETIKAVLSRQVDEYRSAYKRTAEAVPRGCVFYGTTNERDFLIDSSGNRRWLPVEAQGAIALDVVSAMREQYYAEAYALVRGDNAGAYWHVSGAVDVQAAHVARDPWIDTLDLKLRGITNALPEAVENTTAYACLAIPPDKQTGGGTGRRLTAAMRALGYATDRWRIGGRLVRGFKLVGTEAAEEIERRV